MSKKYFEIARKQIIVATILILFVSLAIANPDSSYAADSSMTNADIQSQIDAFEESALSELVIGSSSSPTSLRGVSKSSYSEAALPYDSSQWGELGLIPQSSDSDTEVNSVVRNGDGSYDIVASVSSSVSFKVADGATLVIGGESRSTLTESSVDVHSITAIQNQNGEFEVESDTIQEPVAIDPEQNGILSTPAVPFTSSDNGTSDDFGTNSAGLNYIRAIKYAEEWASKSVRNGNNYDPDNQDVMNPDFPVYDNNCTNFVSQILYAGGLPLAGGNSLQIRDTSVWTWNLAGIAQASRTWSGANYNFTYMKDHSNSFTEGSDPMRAWQGSIIYADWESDGELDHAMFVVGYVSYGDTVSPVIDQMTTPRYDFLFTESVAEAKKANGDKTSWKTLLYSYE